MAFQTVDSTWYGVPDQTPEDLLKSLDSNLEKLFNDENMVVCDICGAWFDITVGCDCENR